MANNVVEAIEEVAKAIKDGGSTGGGGSEDTGIFHVPVHVEGTNGDFVFELQETAETIYNAAINGIVLCETEDPETGEVIATSPVIFAKHADGVYEFVFYGFDGEELIYAFATSSSDKPSNVSGDSEQDDQQDDQGSL